MALPPYHPPPHALILPRVKCHVPSAALFVPPAAPQSWHSRRALDLSRDSPQLTQGELSISSPALPTRMLVSPGGGTSCSRAALSRRLRLSTARGHSDHLWDRTERGGGGRRSRGAMSTVVAGHHSAQSLIFLGRNRARKLEEGRCRH